MMRPLTIVWQRLVTSRGETCDRCGRTFVALQRAVAKLKDVLRPLDLEPTLETIEIQEESFKADPSASNRIWIAGKSLEEWLGARAGSSHCCSAGGESECRTVEVGDAVFEAVPENLILQAALWAAAQMLGASSESRSGEDKVRSCAPTCCVDALGL
jgi:hypothetical protein